MSSTIEISSENKTKIRKLFNVDDETKINKLLKELKEWLKTKHLPEESQDEWYLELMLLHAKFDLTKTKKRISTYFKEIGKHHKLFNKIGPLSMRQEQCQILYSLSLTQQFERVIMIRFAPENVTDNKLDWNKIIRVVLTCALIDFHCDYCAGQRYILDFNNVTLSYMKNWKIPLLFNLARIMENILKMRTSGVEVINAPNIINYFMPIARLILPTKIFNRIKIHTDLESLYENVPRDFLSKDYGGRLWSTDLLFDKREELIRNQQPLINKIASLATKLHLQNCEKIDLRSLNID